ncbi:hypothetical protein DPMN_110854 [Dreissena polymorpha]|uniref:Uncharacterized protein n=1 Tax=Dreissena polymorpha TaxID=45954 RepID=A0A9D4QNG5_DREPO|nr:hypothetical protein DPMN_110854 [Dreissena polymorpha]
MCGNIVVEALYCGGRAQIAFVREGIEPDILHSLGRHKWKNGFSPYQAVYILVPFECFSKIIRLNFPSNT